MVHLNRIRFARNDGEKPALLMGRNANFDGLTSDRREVLLQNLYATIIFPNILISTFRDYRV